MAEQVILDVSDEQKRRIKAQAHKHGYDSIRDYLLALIQAGETDDEVAAYEVIRRLIDDYENG